jgi:excisionase family DNA binding protein
MEDLVTVKELASVLKLTEATIYKLLSSGKLPGFKIGDSWRSDMNEIRKLFRGTRKGLKTGQKIDRPKFGGSEGDGIVLKYH